MPTNSVLDVGAWFETYRTAMMPFVRMNEEALHAVRRCARLQSESLSDYLDSECEHVRAILDAKNPSDLARAHSEHVERLTERWRRRSAQFLDAAAETQGSLSRTAGDLTSQATESAKGVAAESHRRGSEPVRRPS